MRLIATLLLFAAVARCDKKDDTIAELRLELKLAREDLRTAHDDAAKVQAAIAVTAAKAGAERAMLLTESQKLRAQMQSATKTAVDNMNDNHRIERKVDKGLSLNAYTAELAREFEEYQRKSDTRSHVESEYIIRNMLFTMAGMAVFIVFVGAVGLGLFIGIIRKEREPRARP